jgi:hypothetical protein
MRPVCLSLLIVRALDDDDDEAVAMDVRSQSCNIIIANFEGETVLVSLHDMHEIHLSLCWAGQLLLEHLAIIGIWRSISCACWPEQNIVHGFCIDEIGGGVASSKPD